MIENTPFDGRFEKIDNGKELKLILDELSKLNVK
jgi:hypothetical protein